MLTVAEAAERLRVSRSTVYALAASGKLKCCRIGMGRGVLRFTEDQIRAFLAGAEQGHQACPSEAPPRPRRVILRHLDLG